eukprot:3286579-Alexandrium_andersonii.AAC.1
MRTPMRARWSKPIRALYIATCPQRNTQSAQGPSVPKSAENTALLQAFEAGQEGPRIGPRSSRG